MTFGEGMWNICLDTGIFGYYSEIKFEVNCLKIPDDFSLIIYYTNDLHFNKLNFVGLAYEFNNIYQISFYEGIYAN